jgi:hypothetical protein
MPSSHSPSLSQQSVARFGRRLWLVAAATLLPWVVVVLFTAGVSAAAHLIAYALVVTAVGYAVVSLALPSQARTQSVLLAPALGIVIISAIGALWLRLALPAAWIPVLWLCLAIPGAFALFADRRILSKQVVSCGATLAVLSFLICAVFFLLPAKNDAVLRRDGSFNWIYVDTQHFYAIAAIVKSEDGVPTSPGTATDKLRYHFAPYVPAGILSRTTGLDLGDALARVTRGAEIWALLLATFALGTLLSLKATGESFGGILSVTGLFFYGSLMSLFTDETNSSSHVTGAILFRIPDVAVLSDGGPFAHLIFGHSLLHGLVAITALMALCLAYREIPSLPASRAAILLALPALVVPVNSVAALYCIGVVSILLFWGRLRALWPWIAIILVLCLFFASWKIMGFTHSADEAGLALKHHLISEWWSVVATFLIGLGFRIVGFQWLARPFKDPVAALVLATVIGLLFFSLLIQLEDGDERYGIYYLLCLFSIFAFSRLNAQSWRGPQRIAWVSSWLKLASIGLFALAAAAVAFALYTHLRHRHTGVVGLGSRVLLTLTIASAFACILILMRRSPAFSSVASALLMVVLSLGFLGWVAPWLNCAYGRMKMDVTVSPGEVAGLHRLHNLTQPDEWFATNKHQVDSFATRRERSYAYAALAERPVLLEGYLDRGVKSLPWFDGMLHDNDLMFTTTDPGTLRRIAESWHVHWLVARPGTDLSLPRPLPPWLVEQPGSGTLKIYRIN